MAVRGQAPLPQPGEQLVARRHRNIVALEERDESLGDGTHVELVPEKPQVARKKPAPWREECERALQRR